MKVGAVTVFEDIEGAINLTTNKHVKRKTNHIVVKSSREGRVKG